MIEDILADIGLTRSEIRLYLSLLELNVATASELIDHSGMTTSSLHLAINALITKGLINYIVDGKKRIYQATNPDNLVEFLEEKKLHLVEVLPQLKKRQNMSRKKEVATLYKGIKGIKEAYSLLINEPGKEFNSFGDSPEVAQLMTYTWWANLHARREAKKLPCRQLFDERHKKELIQPTLQRRYTKIRFLPKKFAQLQVTVMVGELVGITVFGKNPYAILIRDATLADGYRRYFEVLWELGK